MRALVYNMPFEHEPVIVAFSSEEEKTQARTRIFELLRSGGLWDRFRFKDTQHGSWHLKDLLNVPEISDLYEEACTLQPDLVERFLFKVIDLYQEKQGFTLEMDLKLYNIE